MLDWLKVRLQYILPKHLLSRLVGAFAAGEHGKVTTWVIDRFVQHFNVDMSEAKQEDTSAYPSFNAFFTRELKPGLREFCNDDHVLGHAVDGTVSQCGPIRGDQIFQAKGHQYSLTALLGGHSALAAPFKGGDFATIYLSPRDYHRIHMPLTGTLTDMVYVPGELFSVNPLTAQNVPGLFARNERVVAVFDTAIGKVAIVLVGATIVASIATSWAGTVTPPAGQHITHWQYTDATGEQVTLRKGEEMGLFKLGSTIVVCFEPDRVDLGALAAGQVTRLGQPFAQVKAS